MTAGTSPSERFSTPLGRKIRRRILIAVAVFSAVVLLATLAYILEGWSPGDAFYMVIITVFGVGFREVQPVDTLLGRTTTILSILAGTSATIYVVGSLIQVITEGEIKTAMAESRKLKIMDTIRNHTIVCGFGRIGQTIARELHQAAQPFLILDTDPSRIALSESLGYLSLLGDAGDETVLGRANIAAARNLATVLPNDVVNVFITLTARNLNPSLRILARAENPATEKKLRQAGADEVVLPALTGGLQIAHRISRPSLLGVLAADASFLNDDLLELGVEISEVLIGAGNPLVGQPLGSYVDQTKGRCIILVIRHADGTSSQHPALHSTLQPGDCIIGLLRKSG
jgi:voltage-gated potassium channel